MSLVDNLFSSEEESDVGAEIQIRRRRKWLRDYSNPFEMDDIRFVQNFRVSKDAFLMILEAIECHMKASVRSSAVPNLLKLAACLRFFAEGSYQRGTGNDFHMCLAQPTISLIFKEMFDVLEEYLCPKWISFPYSEQEKQEAKRYFFNKCRIPGVIGCVDGTHIRIMQTAEDTRHHYYNRKGFYSINAMIKCDHLMRIPYINARYPGATHDSLIWNMLQASRVMQAAYDGGDKNTWLLGDAGYALQPFLMTPFRLALSGSIQSEYNKRHSKGRNIIERTNGVLKNRFRCLLGARELHYSPQKATQITYICAALHNICIHYKLDFVYGGEIVEDIENNPIDIQDNLDAVSIRERILKKHYEQ